MAEARREKVKRGEIPRRRYKRDDGFINKTKASERERIFLMNLHRQRALTLQGCAAAAACHHTLDNNKR